MLVVFCIHILHAKMITGLVARHYMFTELGFLKKKKKDCKYVPVTLCKFHVCTFKFSIPTLYIILLIYVCFLLLFSCFLAKCHYDCYVEHPLINY